MDPAAVSPYADLFIPRSDNVVLPTGTARTDNSPMPTPETQPNSDIQQSAISDPSPAIPVHTNTSENIPKSFGVVRKPELEKKALVSRTLTLPNFMDLQDGVGSESLTVPQPQQGQANLATPSAEHVPETVAPQIQQDQPTIVQQLGTGISTPASVEQVLGTGVLGGEPGDARPSPDNVSASPMLPPDATTDNQQLQDSTTAPVIPVQTNVEGLPDKVGATGKSDFDKRPLVARTLTLPNFMDLQESLSGDSLTAQTNEGGALDQTEPIRTGENADSPPSPQNLGADIPTLPEIPFRESQPAEQILSSSAPPATPPEQILSSNPPPATPPEQILSSSAPPAIPPEQILSSNPPPAIPPEQILSSNPPPAALPEQILSSSTPPAALPEQILFSSAPPATPPEQILSSQAPPATPPEQNPFQQPSSCTYRTDPFQSGSSCYTSRTESFPATLLLHLQNRSFPATLLLHLQNRSFPATLLLHLQNRPFPAALLLLHFQNRSFPTWHLLQKRAQQQLQFDTSWAQAGVGTHVLMRLSQREEASVICQTISNHETTFLPVSLALRKISPRKTLPDFHQTLRNHKPIS